MMRAVPKAIAAAARAAVRDEAHRVGVRQPDMLVIRSLRPGRFLMPLPRPLCSLPALCLAALLACDHDERAGFAPRLALAGTYALESVSGRGPVSGTLVLFATGQAERRVRYRLPDGGLSPEYVARGSFELQAGGVLDLALREDDGRSPYVWRPRATLTGDVVELRHPDPADGPDIVDSYRHTSLAAH
jgi:hypothetical protein